MPRLMPDLLERVESFCHRVADVADAMAEKGHSRRIIDQITAAGTSVGANVYEADEAMTRADFARCLCISAKELNESLFWIRFAGRRGWVKASRTADLEDECVQLKKLLGSMIARTKRPTAKPQI